MIKGRDEASDPSPPMEQELWKLAEWIKGDEEAHSLSLIERLSAKDLEMRLGNCFTRPPAIVLSSRWGRINIVTALLDKGVNIDATDTKKTTALMNSIDQGHHQVTDALLHKCANVQIVDEVRL